MLVTFLTNPGLAKSQEVSCLRCFYIYKHFPKLWMALWGQMANFDKIIQLFSPSISLRNCHWDVLIGLIGKVIGVQLHVTYKNNIFNIRLYNWTPSTSVLLPRLFTKDFFWNDAQRTVDTDCSSSTRSRKTRLSFRNVCSQTITETISRWIKAKRCGKLQLHLQQGWPDDSSKRWILGGTIYQGKKTLRFSTFIVWFLSWISGNKYRHQRITTK